MRRELARLRLTYAEVIQMCMDMRVAIKRRTNDLIHSFRKGAR